MNEDNQSSPETNIYGNVTGSAVGGGSVNARNIAGGDIHEHHYGEQEIRYPVTNLPLGNLHFVGREAHLQALTAAAPGSATTITQTIAGLGGVGKSQLMLYFAHQQHALKAYDIVWWLRVDEALAEDFLALGRQLGLAVAGIEQAAAVQLVRNWLNGTDKRWLLLCDNADETEPRQLRAFLPQNPQGRILITSRNPGWQGLGSVLRLDVFTAAEAADFWVERLVQSLRLNQSAAEGLAEELGRLPLALEHAAAYMAENGLDAAGYLALYRAQRQKLWQYTPAPDDYHATITTTWEIGFEKARQTPGAADLLNLCCFLAADDIPLALLVDYAEALPDALAAVLNDELARNAALSAVARYSLLARSDGALRIHRLVQTVARDRMGEERAKIWAEVAVELMAASLPETWTHLHEWVNGPKLLPHLMTVSDLASEINLTEQVAYLCTWTGYYLNSRGAYTSAQPFYERALVISEKALGPEHPNTATSLNNLGYLLQDIGHLAEAQPFLERALAIREKALGPEHPDTATSLNNLGGLLQAMGNLAEARPLFERALAINKKTLGPEHADTATSLNNLGGLLKAMGNLGEARLFYERALAIYEAQLGPDHPTTATSLNNLGGLLKAMGNLAEALPFYERALAIDEKALGPDHPDTATSLNNLGGLLKAMGSYAEAQSFYERALAIYEAQLGPKHPTTAASLNNVGLLLYEMGSYAEALPFYERALVIREAQLGPNHPDTANSLNNLGSLLQAMGSYAEARPFYERALSICEKTLGTDHPHTKVVRNNLQSLESELNA